MPATLGYGDARMSDDQQIPELEPQSTEFDVGDRKHVEKKNRKVKLTENQANIAIRGVMGCPEGRAFFWWMLEECHVHHNGFNTNGLTMAFNLGERNIGLKFEARLAEVCPDEFALMMTEARRKQDA